MTTLTLKALGKRYPNGNTALEPLDLTITDGELIVIVGPSGCGKSTLLRCIAGLEDISQGDLLLDGASVKDKEPASRNIAMVFQNYALYPHMTVAENMGYALKNRGMARPEREQRVKATARLLGIESFLDRRPRQLSGGQRQRVAMGRAIVRDPSVFLFDEPLSNLDAALRVQMRLEIKRLLNRLKTTAVYVTHDQVEAMTLADRLVVINHGHIEQVGTPLELYNHPASSFVARFLGSPAMNLVTLDPNNGQHDLVSRIASLGDEEISRVASLGIRPEHLHETSADRALLLLTVAMVEPLGADTLVYGHVQGITEQLVVRLAGTRELPVGSQLALKTEAHHLHLFDAEGLRLKGKTGLGHSATSHSI